jgi:YidC/Oxa1 family membrane protein insertase
MDIQRVLILLGLAVTSYMLILAWNEDYGQGKPQPTTETVQGQQPVDDDLLPDSGIDDIAPEDTSASDVPELKPVDTRQNAGELPQNKEGLQPTRKLVSVTTDVFEIKIDLHGGDIVSVALPLFPETLETPDIPFLMVDPKNSYVAQSGLIGPNGTDRTGHRPTFKVDKPYYELGDADELNVTLNYTQENGVTVAKTFRFKRGDYLIGIEYKINNSTTEDWQGALFAQIKRDGQKPFATNENAMGLKPYVGAATRTDTELYKKLEFDDVEEESYRATMDEGYIAMVQHYFVSAWIPNQPGTNYRGRKLDGQDVYLFGFTAPPVHVLAGATGTISAEYYVGPKDQYRLRDIAEGLDLTVDYGFLWWLAQPLFYLLTTIHGVFSNWGVAIICLTIIVKTLLYPLSAASFRSMAKMRKLQPEMARLKERFGDDRQQFSQAMMDLYKKEGANPLGGCFPILLQMPVFLALYWTLMESVELRQAPFMLWIHDLSAMDPYFILPILMGISMFLTQRMQPEPPDPVQAKVFKFMPIMFTFFFLWFPSGLVLYWLVNNILSILQQWYVTRQLEAKG